MIFNSTTLIVEKLKISASNNKAVLETMATGVVANPIHREKNGRLDLKECRAWGFSTAHGRSSK